MPTVNHDKHILKGTLHPAVRAYLTEQAAKGGKIGGRSKSPAKVEAARKNGAKKTALNARFN